jgi:TolB-like protein
VYPAYRAELAGGGRLCREGEEDKGALLAQQNRKPDASAMRLVNYDLEDTMFQKNNDYAARVARRLAAVCVLVCAGLGGLYAQTAVTLDEAIRRVAADIEARLEPDSKVAILDFNTMSERLSAHVVDELSTLLINDGLDVLDRKNLALIDEEMTFQASGEVSDSSMQSFGQKLGAQAIISGNMEDLGEYYRIRFRTLEVETARVLRISSANVRKDDQQIARLMQGKAYMDTKRFVFGADGGWGIGLYSLDDLKKEFSEAAIHSLNHFQAAVYGAYNFNTRFAVQLELNVVTNGMVIDATETAWFYDGYTEEDGSAYWPSWDECKINDSYTYTSLDIPLLARVNFRPIPAMLVSVMAGPYVSLPVSDLKNEWHYPNWSQVNDNRSDQILNVTFGALARVTAGFSVGPGYIAAGARFRNDFVPITADYLGEGEVKDMFTRRVITFSIGYEFWI